ncbi:sulfite exporter TauE/SafE family protein [Pseudanabaena sp. FACHB-2040]|uniref:urease accessory protein UreH domain-containing protein n=1 Tax=Pseudanabaena sp. FACHB-2040 TaxID=2692859 RepID=UPI001682C8D6|nr:sulfite exporter TauE/SafE family protein [Pseudanabaena sp. FACHB-2040]MBD2260988.1 sulfite exporter TauE/SafE family protein [Pseudanabaena sp. FACHB-2040]
MLDLFLITSLGFLGSFGHCLGMCGPLTVAFSLGHPAEAVPSRWQSVRFHLLLNLGRLLSYALIGAVIGGIGSVLVAGGQVAGIGSGLRRAMALGTGGLLIWFGLAQVSPGLLPKLPFLHPMLQGQLHERLQKTLTRFSLSRQWWTPLLLGLVWGLIPCGFLYAAQIKAAETAHPAIGAATMLAFGLGTLPIMLGVGLSASWLGQDRRSQLFRLGGWLTLLIGVLTLMRTGEAMTDYAGYGALVALVLALVARPISKLWSGPLRYRRVLGVGAFILSLAHSVQMVEHSWGWNFRAFEFMLPRHQWGVIMGASALVLMLPLALTSTDWAQRALGTFWRNLHLLSIPALLLCTLHCLMLGTRYLGSGHLSLSQSIHTGMFVSVVGLALMMRSHWLWSLLSLDRYYVPPKRS